MKRIFTILICALCFGHAAEAQVAKQVEVSKNYVPSVAPASKLPIEPDMVDTVMMRPEIDYTIVPRTFSSSLGTRRFNPAKITYWEYNREYPFYLKAGIGYPLNTVVDAYASTERADVGYLGAYVNHRGQYSKIKVNDPVGGDAFKNNSQQIVNKAGITGGKYLGRYTLSGDLFYRSDIYHRYPLLMPEFERREVNFENVDLKLGFGDSFSDLGHLNFKVYAKGDFYNDKSQSFSGDAKFQQVDAFVGAVLSRKIARRSIFRISFDYRGYFGLKDLSAYSNNIFSATFRYAYVTRRGLNLKAGLTYCYDVHSLRKDYHRFLPYLYLTYNPNGKGPFVPFLELDGSVENNSYWSLLKRNPYIDVLEGGNVASLPNTLTYNFRFGVSGHTRNSKFAYRFYANMAFVENAIYWYNVNRIYFDAKVGLENVWSLCAEMDYKPISQLYMSLQVKGMIYDTRQSVDLKDARSPIEAAFRMRYSHKKFAVGAKVELVGQRKWTSVVYPEFGVDEKTTTSLILPTDVDVGLNVDWYVTPKCTVFAEGNNLANMNIYKYAFYREYGANFTVGVKLQF